MVITSSGATPLHYLMKWPLGDMAKEKSQYYAQCLSAFKKIFYLMLDKGIHLWLSSQVFLLPYLLFSTGAIVNAQNNYGETPLHQATSLPFAVEMILDHGANVNLRTV